MTVIACVEKFSCVEKNVMFRHNTLHYSVTNTYITKILSPCKDVLAKRHFCYDLMIYIFHRHHIASSKKLVRSGLGISQSSALPFKIFFLKLSRISTAWLHRHLSVRVCRLEWSRECARTLLLFTHPCLSDESIQHLVKTKHQDGQMWKLSNQKMPSCQDPNIF